MKKILASLLYFISTTHCYKEKPVAILLAYSNRDGSTTRLTFHSGPLKTLCIYQNFSGNKAYPGCYDTRNQEPVTLTQQHRATFNEKIGLIKSCTHRYMIWRIYEDNSVTIAHQQGKI